MKRTLAAQTVEKIGEKVKLAGWVNSRRDHGKLVFIDLRDKSGVVQVVGGADFARLRPEDLVEIEGKVITRPKELVNPKIETGTVEVKAAKIKVLNHAETLPFPIDTPGHDIEEEVRLKYRYLDLRRPRLQKIIHLRSQLIQYARQYLFDNDFVEIETPILTKATPEGARDFLVPSRLQPGKFYALPQSPQQYKQLLMVAGFERYFQIARCFRDEDPRADRSYGEFSQLDIEMSFVTQDDILTLVEELFKEITEKVFKKKVYQFPFPRIGHDEAIRKYKSDKFDLRDKKDPNVLAFAFVVDFPLFEKTADQPISPSHHPFTAPKDEDIPLLDKDPMRVRSWQHDLVCNGLEVGGGSIRITNPDIQRKIFKILGYKDVEIEKKFGHLLRAFNFGVPPHGGIAPGIERLLMVATGEENTREVTAFPMASSGQTAVMDAPSEVEEEQILELGIKIIKPKKRSNSK